MRGRDRALVDELRDEQEILASVDLRDGGINNSSGRRVLSRDCHHRGWEEGEGEAIVKESLMDSRSSARARARFND